MKATTRGEGSRRYYQDAAIRAVLEKLAFCEIYEKPKRALLSMATGSGKTHIAVNMLKRIEDAGQLKCALFLCDRDELRSQALRAFRDVFGSDVGEVYQDESGANNARNARIHIATYQTLGILTGDQSDNFLSKHYRSNHFSHIIIDECHRSAWGHWSQVLTQNEDGCHIGLTATPRKIRFKENMEGSQDDKEITSNNVRYFGEPVYEYTIFQAMEDGYLARCEVQRNLVSLDETGITKAEILEKSPIDPVTGAPLSETEIQDMYDKTQFESSIVLPDRVRAMCEHLFLELSENNNPEQKTVVFCVRDQHADSVAVCLNNIYAEWCEKNGHALRDYFAFKCTATSQGNEQLPDFRGSKISHFIATTVDLLTTGVDIPCLRNVVFFRYVNSPISFFQMVGRGTRIDESSGKLSFRIYDYTNATRHFDNMDYTVSQVNKRADAKPESQDATSKAKTIRILQIDGFSVHITGAGQSILIEDDGKRALISIEEYRARLGSRLLRKAKSLGDFREKWTDTSSRKKMLLELSELGYPASIVHFDRKEYDLYDVLGEIGWGLSPKTKLDRANSFEYKNGEWLHEFPTQTAKVIQSLVRQFGIDGTDSLENAHIFEVPEVVRAGGLDALKAGGIPARLLRETKSRVFTG